MTASNFIFQKITMRYIRQPAPLHENKENTFLNDKDQQRLDQLKLQIKSAYTQISMLRETNKKLLWRMEVMEKQKEGQQQMKEELDFLREQEERYKLQLANHDEINRRLREELERTDKERLELAEKLKFYTHQEENRTSTVMTSNRSQQTVTNQISNPRISDYKSTKFPRDISARTSFCLSTSNQRSRQNHHSTPKSKLKINIEQLIPQSINQRKKVFF